MPRKGQSTKAKVFKAKAKVKPSPGKKCDPWSEFDEAKLLKLFQTGAVDLKDIDAKAVHLVINKYFHERPYSSFAALYRRKLRQFNIEQLKSGHRRGKFDSILCIDSFFMIIH